MVALTILTIIVVLLTLDFAVQKMPVGSRSEKE